MFLTILAAFAINNPSIDAIVDNRLDSPEGRTLFLTERLQPYVDQAEALNQEIVQLSEEVAQKMAVLGEMLPTLNLALHVDQDFQQIDAILNCRNLSAEQQEIADRIAQICAKIDAATCNEPAERL